MRVDTSSEIYKTHMEENDIPIPNIEWNAVMPKTLKPRCAKALNYVLLRRPVVLNELNHRRKEKLTSKSLKYAD